MKNRLSTSIGRLLLFVFCFSLLAVAQEAKPYHDGPVWDIGFIRAKAGMERRYLTYLTGEWKQEQEALKKAGYVLDYKVITTEAHGPQDFNILLMTEFKDLASMEANSDKMEDVALKLAGGEKKAESGYEDRASYREIMADRIGREIILEPKGAK